MKNGLTTTQHSKIDMLYHLINKKLFEGNLPDAIITIRSGIDKRKSGVYAKVSIDTLRNLKQNKKTNDNSGVSEIAVYLDVHSKNSKLDTKLLAQSLAHEMCHVYQYRFGKPTRSKYHNRQFAAIMEKIGLMASDTGKPGGKKTGQSMLDYIIPDGVFDRFMNTDGQFFSLDVAPKHEIDIDGIDVGNSNSSDSGKKNKTKYSCLCANIWGKPGLSVKCIICGTIFMER